MRLEKDKNAVDLAERELQAWLEYKKRMQRQSTEPVNWTLPGVHRLWQGAELHVVHDDYEGENVRRHLYRLIETKSTGTFVVSIYAAALPGLPEKNQTIVVEVEKLGTDQESALNLIDPPRIAKALLEASDIRDGRTPLTGKPIIVRPGETRQVVQAITDPSRIASVIVAGSSSPGSDDEWFDVVRSLTRQSVGVAATFVVNADAMGELEASLGPSHHVGGGRVRTYLPKVDLLDSTDSLRHKWLGPATLARSLDGRTVSTPLQRRHAEVARRRFVETELPADVRRTMGILRRAETTAERESRVSERVASERSRDAARAASSKRPTVTEPTTDDTSAFSDLRADHLIKRWLGIEHPKPEHLEVLDAFVAAKVAESEIAAEQLEVAATREDDLDDQVKALQRRIEDMELDLAQAEQDEIENQRERFELRRRLAQSSNPDTYVERDAVEWEAPDSVEELVGRITLGVGSHPALEYVEFTGDVEGALEVDKRYPSGLYAGTLWTYVRVLHDYATAKLLRSFGGNVHMYLSDDRTDGVKCALARHASHESDTVLQNVEWSAQRVFPVPTSVDSSGSVLMEAHFKPTFKDTFAPRMYYFDDTNPGGTGKIYIGYIGRHLANTRN